MESFREIISKHLRANRAKISDSSIKTYSSMLCSINKKLGGEKELEFFSKDKDKIINHIKENITSFQTQKTLLSALYILTDLKEVSSKSGNKSFETVLKSLNEFEIKLKNSIVCSNKLIIS